MRERVLHDPGEPVPIRTYASESLAAVDRAALAAARIPTFLRQNRYAEVEPGKVVLMVRRGDVGAALEIIDGRADD